MEDEYLDKDDNFEDYEKLYFGDDRLWHPMFGFSKETTIEVWNFLKTRSLPHQRFKFRYLLWFFFFLKNYPSDDDVGAHHFRVARSTYENWIWKVVDELTNIHTVRSFFHLYKR